jgi:hypothetical protein
MISWKGRHLKIGECPFILWSYLVPIAGYYGRLVHAQKEAMIAARSGGAYDIEPGLCGLPRFDCPYRNR